MTTQLTISPNALIAKQTESFTALSFATRATLRTLSVHSHVPANLHDEASRLGLTPTGPIHYVYTGVNGDEGNTFDLVIALPVQQAGDRPFGFSYQTFPLVNCVSYTYTGSWSDFPILYDSLFQTFYQMGYQNDGRLREVYTRIDLEHGVNCITEIQIAIV